MTGLPLATERPADRTRVGVPAAAFTAVAICTALAVAGVALALWIGPWYFDGALDRAGSPAILDLPPAEVHALSASVVAELLVGPGTFAQAVAGADGQPVRFFGANEAAHLRDVSFLVRLFTLAVLAALIVLGLGLTTAGRRPWFWSAVSRGAAGLATGLVGAGLVFAVAFEPAFTLFHLIFFPGGNWSFDPRQARMVQLYPTPFWEEVVLVYAFVAVGLALLVRALARRRAPRWT